MKGHPVIECQLRLPKLEVCSARPSSGVTYNLVETLGGTETGRASADDKDVNVANRS